MIRPLHDNLVLRPLHAPGKVGYLYMPDIGKSGNKSQAICEVLAVGPGTQERHERGPNIGKPYGRIIPCSSKVGDKVSVAAYGTHFAGDEIEHNGEKLVIIRERDINGIVQD